MPKQPAIPGLRDAMKKKVTRREQFLAEMEAVVPWMRLLALIAPHYPKAGPKGGRPPMPLETMLRVYFLQNWYALSDPMAEETLYDSEAMRRFAGIELGDDRIPDETTILNFRHLLERHGLTEAIFADVNAHLADKGITLRSGTLVDATIIDAPSSTKNKAGARDPEMSSTKKGNTWYFGMKAHVGVDAASGVWPVLEDAGFFSDVSDDADAWTRSKIAAAAILYLESGYRLGVVPEPNLTDLTDPTGLALLFGSRGNLDDALWEIGRALVDALSPDNDPPLELLVPLLRSLVLGAGVFREGPHLDAYLRRVSETDFSMVRFREDELRRFWVGGHFSFDDLLCSVGPMRI